MFAKIMMFALLVSACGEPQRQASGTEARRASELPSVRVDGKDYPYIQYPEMSGKKESRGRAFFMYPMTDLKNRLSALEYTPGMKIENLFAEDVIGISGSVVQNGRQIRVEFLPISVPIGVAVGQEWKIQYARREFTCKSRVPMEVQGISKLIKVSCISGSYTLAFKFHREFGVTEYQDFCDFSVCTYKLADSQGLLSRSMTDFMGLPHI